MGGRIKIGMEGIQREWGGMQAGYYKSRDGGREGVREGGREGWRISRMKELKPLYQLQVYI